MVFLKPVSGETQILVRAGLLMEPVLAMGSSAPQFSSFLEILASGNESCFFGGKTELYHSVFLKAGGRGDSGEAL